MGLQVTDRSQLAGVDFVGLRALSKWVRLVKFRFIQIHSGILCPTRLQCNGSEMFHRHHLRGHALAMQIGRNRRQGGGARKDLVHVTSN